MLLTTAPCEDKASSESVMVSSAADSMGVTESGKLRNLLTRRFSSDSLTSTDTETHKENKILKGLLNQDDVLSEMGSPRRRHMSGIDVSKNNVLLNVSST